MINHKAEYVRAEIRKATDIYYCDATIGHYICGKPKGHEGRHEPAHLCHWPDCTRRVPPAAWGCKPHWYRIPKSLRDKIWKAFSPGQEITKSPTRDYVDAAKAVQDWIASTKDAEPQGKLL